MKSRGFGRDVATSRRIGVLRVGSIGDHVIALPLYRAVRAAHITDSLALITNVPAAGNPKLVGPASVVPDDVFDAVHAYPALSGWRNLLAAMQLLRTLRLDRLYYLMPRRTAAQLRRDRVALWLLTREVVGLNTAATEAIRAAGGGLYEHESARLARAVNIPAPNLEGSAGDTLGLSAQEHSLARGLSGPSAAATVVVALGTKCEVNHWGGENWKRLITLLGQRTHVRRLFLIGSGDEYAQCEGLAAAWPHEARNFCGRLSPRQSAALIAEANLFIGHDSGPMHLAAAVGVPIVAVYSSRNLPGVWYPLSRTRRIHYRTIDCMGCGKEHCPTRQKECIYSIGVDEVLESCMDLLGPDR